MRNARFTLFVGALLLGVGFSHCQASSQVLFERSKLLTASVPGVISVRIADIDSDGKPDVVANSFDDRRVVWFRNLGNNRFSDPRLIASGITSAADLQVGDTDGDGDVDVLATGFYSYSAPFDYQASPATLLLNVDPLHDVWHATSLIQTQSMASMLADQDGDGRVEAILGAYDKGITNVMEVVHSEGSNRAASSPPFPIGMARVRPDGGGPASIVIASGGSQALGILSAPVGSDELTDYSEIPTKGIGATSIVSANLDGEGDGVVVAFGGSNTIEWFPAASGSGLFKESVVIASGLSEPAGLAIADLDGNSQPDVIVTERGAGRVTWFPNTDGSFGSGIHIDMDSWHFQGLRGVAAGDMDNDNDIDLVVGDQSSGRICFLPNNGSGLFGASYAITEPTYVPTEVAVLGEVTGDELADVIYYDASAGDFPGVLYDNGDIAAHEWDSQFLLQNVPEDISALEMSDVTGDARPDLILRRGGEAFVCERTNQSASQGTVFLAPRTVPVTSTTTLGLFSTVDGDEDRDYLFYDSTLQQIMWSSNVNGFSVPQTPQLLVDVDGPMDRLFHVDMDGDELMDLVWSEGTTVYWAQGTEAPATFEAASLFAELNSALLVIADLNADGSPDFVTNRSGLSIALNDGSGSIGEQSQVWNNGFTGGVSSISVDDLNDDGLVDLLFQTANGGIIGPPLYDLFWSRNTGTANPFTGSYIRILNVTTNPVEPESAAVPIILTGDVDSDGDVDLVNVANGACQFHFNTTINHNRRLDFDMWRTGGGWKDFTTLWTGNSYPGIGYGHGFYFFESGLIGVNGQADYDAMALQHGTGSDKLYRFTTTLSNPWDDPTQVPVIRLRTSGRLFDQSDLLVITSTGDAALSPWKTGSSFEHVFTLPTSTDSLRLDIDSVGYDPTDSAGAATYVQRAAVDTVLASELTGHRLDKTYSFANNQRRGWVPVGAPGAAIMPVMEETQQGLSIRAGDSEPGDYTFGYWDSTPSANPVIIDGGRLYEVKYTVTSDVADANVVPTFRLRMNTSSLRASAYVNIESLGTAPNVPTTGNSKTYSTWFLAPQETDGESLLLAFDLLHVPGAGNTPTGNVVLSSVTVNSYDSPW